MKKIIYILVLVVLLSRGTLSYSEEGFKYEDNDKRDPMWPLVNTEGVFENFDNNLSVSDLALEGVMLGTGDSSLAIINGKIVKLKDKIGEFTVKEIHREKVFLIKGPKIFELRLKKEE